MSNAPPMSGLCTSYDTSKKCGISFSRSGKCWSSLPGVGVPPPRYTHVRRFNTSSIDKCSPVFSYSSFLYLYAANRIRNIERSRSLYWP